MAAVLAYPRYYYDMGLYAIVMSLYCFVLFGISMLITPFSEKPRSGLKLVTDMVFAAVYTLYLVGQLASLLGVAGLFEDIADASEYVMLVVALYVLAILVIMAIKALGLARRASQEHHRRGMTALGISFILLVTTVILLIANTVVVTDYDHLLEIITISIAVVTFYMLYLGFVKPADVEKEAP
ncbi:MAG: hypothetical protein GYA24_02980 [Candidatus Lokiarchaeota archaeon]|nr:hypothetical protein [Candidatus Lokiarchaeota archaeon]